MLDEMFADELDFDARARQKNREDDDEVIFFVSRLERSPLLANAL